MKIITSHERKATAFVYYFFAFMLLWEWLRPLQEVTDTANTYIFVIFIGVSFLLLFLKLRWYVTFPIKMILILIILHGLYFDGIFFRFLWMEEFIRDIIRNTSLIQSGNWNNITSSYRSLLFFILLWLLVYLIHYWILFQKRILYFLLLTLLYITVLDTFTPYDATLAIVRTVLIGFFMLGMLHFDRLKIVENLKVKRATSIRWMLPLLAFVLLSMFLALIAPKASPQWPDPVPFITAIGREDDADGGIKKIGFSQNDEKLGGGFVEDDTDVFTHVSADRHYWRVETKDVYTGKGWEVSNPESKLEELINVAEKLSWTDERVETKSLTSSVTIDENYRHFHLMYPLGLTSIRTDQAMSFYLNQNTELITPFLDNEGSREEFMAYEVSYDLPSYPINEMRKEQRFTDKPEGFIERYTQLPDALPNRVKELALEITADKENQYDKAKAIESYFSSAEFSYETEDVAIPERDQDYVDQFLFETLKGYCDNFSTAMIALLRANDIPSRWVKGYTEGDFIKNINNDKKEYQVTNNNAHSWVEVYFEGVGWVPFEPTKGFVNPYEMTSDYRNVKEQDQQEAKDESAKKEEQTQEKQVQEEKESPSMAANPGVNLFGSQLAHTSLYGIILLLLLVGFIFYKTRMRWLPMLIINKYKKRTDDEVFFQAYGSLLKQLDRFGMKRREGQTLRDYAHEIDGYFQNGYMSTLTKNYERALYRRDNAKLEWERSIELWENLIKWTSS